MFSSQSLYSGVSFTFLALSLALFLAGQSIQPSDLECAKSISSWSPAWDTVEHKWETFQNGFSQKSIYRGTPTPELEEAWNASLQQYPIAVSSKKLPVSDGAETQLVQVESGEGILAYLEVFRNLGCLNLLRQHTYREEYDYSYLDAFKVDVFWDNTDISAHHIVRVNGTFNQSSPFRGPPTKAVDDAWAKYWQTWTFSVDEEQFKASMPQYTEEAVRLDDGRYLATFEYTHQLHCLYNLFRASYMDSYPDEKASYEENPREWHDRVDHCTEILRQKLECDRDTGLVLYDWVDRKKAPTANFNVARMCHNWGPVERWAQEHQITDLPKKPDGVAQLSRIP
ncbi:hypothetical protein V8C35DRAFT_275149 [Trichoderma chlorosporum]